MRRGTCPSAGGGACRVAPVVALPTLRSHPRWSPRWGLHGACSLRARSCGPSRTLSPLPPHPAALSSGGGALFAPPYLHPPPSGGRRCGGGGGGGRPCRLPFVARTSQARRKHGAGTRRGTCPSAGGGACRESPVVAPPTLRAHPRGGGGVWGGGAPLSSSLRCTHVAGTTQARRKHGVRHLAAAGGGGFLLWAFQPSSTVGAPHPRISSRRCPLAVVARTRTAHDTTHGNYPLPCPLCSLPRPQCSHGAEQCPCLPRRSLSLLRLSGLFSLAS